MACKGFYSISTPSTKPHEACHCAQYLNNCTFPARLKRSLISPRRRLPTLVSGFGKKTRKKVESDPWESLFHQLEKDLENDTEDSNGEEITEEDIANFERELDMVVEGLANVSNMSTTTKLDDILGAQNKDKIKDNDDKEGSKAKKVGENVDVGNNKDGNEDSKYDDEYFSDDDFEEPRKVPLQHWQLRKLAAAVELGRRKVHVKSLAAELKIDRDDVLFFLKNPPPELLMAARNMEEERSEHDESVSNGKDQKETNDLPLRKDPGTGQASSINEDLESHKTKRRAFGPRDWIKGKRIKKVNLATLQHVYKRTKRPSNAMIESVVQATNLPRVRVLKWFEEERAESCMPEPPRQSAASRKAWKRPVTHSFERLQ